MYWVGAWVLWGKWTILRGATLQCILLSQFFDRLLILYYSLSPMMYIALLTGALESVQQRLWDNFSKQSKEEQGLYYCQLMALSAALARGSVNGHARAADYHCQLILHAISHHFYSVLRPKILATTEMVRPQSNCAFSLLDCITCTRHTVPRCGLLLPIFRGLRVSVCWDTYAYGPADATASQNPIIYCLV